jgi:hypothetical protein
VAVPVLNPGALGQKDWACRHCQMYHATRIQNPFSCDIQIPLHHSPRLGRLTGFFVNRYTDRCPIPPPFPYIRYSSENLILLYSCSQSANSSRCCRQNTTQIYAHGCTPTFPLHHPMAHVVLEHTGQYTFVGAPDHHSLCATQDLDSHCLALLAQPSLLTLWAEGTSGGAF